MTYVRTHTHTHTNKRTNYLVHHNISHSSKTSIPASQVRRPSSTRDNCPRQTDEKPRTCANIERRKKKKKITNVMSNQFSELNSLAREQSKVRYSLNYRLSCNLHFQSCRVIRFAKLRGRYGVGYVFYIITQPPPGEAV